MLFSGQKIERLQYGLFQMGKSSNLNIPVAFFWNSFLEEIVVVVDTSQWRIRSSSCPFNENGNRPHFDAHQRRPRPFIIFDSHIFLLFQSSRFSCIAGRAAVVAHFTALPLTRLYVPLEAGWKETARARGIDPENAERGRWQVFLSFFARTWCYPRTYTVAAGTWTRHTRAYNEANT